MQPVLLIINVCSSSIKFAFFSTPQLNYLYREQILVQWLTMHFDTFHLQAVGHRIVLGGHQFTKPVVNDSNMFQQMRTLISLAPLHQPHNLAAIEILLQLQHLFTQAACFNQVQAGTAQAITLSKNLFSEDIRSYDFHGLSYEYFVTVLPDYSKTAAIGKMLIVHLGKGASLCILQNGKSMATTMTFTPLDGLPMRTHCGSIDPTIVLYLLRKKQLSVDTISNLLQYRSDLKGLSDISGDVQILLKRRHPDAQKAIDVIIYQIIRDFRAIAAALLGLNSLILTAGIGEPTYSIRKKNYLGIAWLGIEHDHYVNNRNVTKICTAQSPVSVCVILTDEAKMIATHLFISYRRSQ